MNLKTSLLTVLLVLACSSLLVGKVGAVQFWIKGTVAGQAEEKDYGQVYVEFPFNITNSTAGLVGINVDGSIICDILRSVKNVSDFPVGQPFNFTGEVTGEPPTANGVPAGHFLISSINVEEAPSPSWVTTLKDIFFTIASVGKMTVTFVVQVIGALFGIEVPTYIVSLALVGVLALFFVKWGKKLPWILAIVTLLVCVALVSDMLLGLHLL
jgi:hypothetical protein